jgi:hypothetical protein
MTKKNLVETSIEFGGFYESVHESRIDYMISSYYEDNNYPEYNFDNIDYKKTFKSYIDDWASKFRSFIFNEYQVDISFNDLKLYSPKYYNYDTDNIDCKVNFDEMITLNKKILTNIDFLDWLKERTESYSGYISFYTFEEAKDNKNNILIKYVLEFLANQFNEKCDCVEFDIILLKEKVA